jgi:thiopeptide-type bacteriocin biosynthesis protein
VSSPYKVASHAILRAPLLPFDTLAQMSSDRAAARAALRAIVEDPAVREAIFLASPSLDETIGAWLADPESPDSQQIERALHRYVARMAGRSTPFGLCSGVVAIRIGDRTELPLGPRTAHRRHLRFDNDYLASLSAELAKVPEVRASLAHRPNTSLYLAAGKLRYAEVRHTGGRSFHLVAVEPTDYLVALLERAATGAQPGALVEALCEDPEVEAADAFAYVDELIETQILVSELEPRVTGPEPAGRLIEILSAIPAAAAQAASLRAAEGKLAALDSAPLGVPTSGYRELAKQLADSLPVKAPVERLYQADLHLAAPEASLGPELVEELAGSIDLLRAIGGHGEDDLWPRFRKMFGERYETREVPLFDVLDEEIGVGFFNPDAYNAPLLADVAFPMANEPRKVTWSAREQHLASLIHDAVARGATEIALGDKDVERLSKKALPAIQPTIAVTAIIAARSPEAVVAGDYSVLIRGIDAPSVRMLGRFCHGSGEIEALVRAEQRAEEAHAPDAIYAEVVHLPEGRMGNILLRPLTRPYEIPYLGAGGAEPAFQIPVSDLLVSVVGDRVHLRSKRLGKRIVPRLTTAHNFSNRSLGVYRFLCSLAWQDGSGASFQIGPLGDAPFVPRIRRGRLVLARARWTLQRDDLAPLDAAAKGSKSAKSAADLAAIRDRERAAMTALRDRRRMPRWIVVSDSDNELPIDLDNPIAVDSAVHLIKGRPGAVIHELYPPPDELLARGPDGGYVHEIVVPFSRAPSQAAKPAIDLAGVALPEPPAPIPRRFPPGSPWLYAKIYTGSVVADSILREIVAPLVEAGRAAKLFDRWFFIRYGEAGWHLRLRFHGAPAALYGGLLPRLSAAFAGHVEAGGVWRIQLDTYEREVERYGGPAAMLVAEQIFAADSDAALAILAATADDDSGQTAWLACLRGIDRLLDDFALQLPEKLAVMTALRDGFGREFNLDTEFQRRLGTKFRKHRAEIEAMLAGEDTAERAPIAAALAARSEVVAPLAAELHRLRAARAIPEPIHDLVKSYIHMHVNRVLRYAHRAQEVVLYDMLRRHLDGVSARARQRAGGGG